MPPSGFNRESFDRIAEFMIKAGGMRVRAGIFAGHAGATDETVNVATIHEFGAPRANIPERSYIRSTMKERKQELAIIMRKIVGQMIRGEISEYEALTLIGGWLAGAIKNKILHGPFAPLAYQTILRKGHATPLVDTGHMYSAVTFVITE